jgi:hypothetical protein
MSGSQSRENRGGRERVFKAKEKLHRSRAKLPFREKIKILAELQRIASGWDKTKG